MKMSRDDLKNLIKECLIEVLNEGIGSQRAMSQVGGRVSEIRGSQATRPRASTRGFDPNLDTPVSQGRKQSTALREAIRESAGGNPLMASIFADTAATTLPSQMQHGDSGPMGGSGMPPPQEQFSGAPEEVFGEEVAGRWANLAFAAPQGPNKAA